MISALHSIDVLLNRFDELSKCHNDLLSDFELNITDGPSPLKPIEQRKHVEKISLSYSNSTEKSASSLGILGDFHRRVIVNRHLHRPPNYSSCEPCFTKPVVKKPPPMVNVAPLRRTERKVITVFSVQTIDRLSQPKRYNRLPELNGYLKRKQQRAKPYEIRQKEAVKRPILTKPEKTNRSNKKKKLVKK